MRETQKNIDLTAANWVAKMVNGDLSASEREELNAWLDTAPENQQAFIEANNALAVMDDAIKSTDRTTESPSSEVVELKHPAKPPSKAPRRRNVPGATSHLPQACCWRLLQPALWLVTRSFS